MATNEEKVILKKNGQVVMQALQDIRKPPTLLNLTKHIAETYSTEEKKVKAPLKNVLDSGIELGIITRNKGKYYLYGDVAASENEQSEEEVGDATGKRRRRRRSNKRGTSHQTTTAEGMAANKKSKNSASRSRSRSRRGKSRRRARKVMSE